MNMLNLLLIVKRALWMSGAVLFKIFGCLFLIVLQFFG